MTQLQDIPIPDLHVVIFVRNLRTTAGIESHSTIVAGPTDWLHAQDIWTNLDARRRQRAAQTTRIVDSYLKVRSIQDPEVAPLLAQCSFHKNKVLAAKAWGKANGVTGKNGGWIYGLPKMIGGPVQGWASAAYWLEKANDIALAKHPRHGGSTWVNYGAPVVVSHPFKKAEVSA